MLERPEAATFLARKLYRCFVSEAGTPGPELIEPLAAEIKQHDFAIGPVVEVILRSQHFYSRSVYRQRIKSPVEFSAGLVRMLEVPRAAINPLALSAACDAQGQELFAPPNVEGWVGGPIWINSAHAARANQLGRRRRLGPRRERPRAVRSAGLGRPTTRSPADRAAAALIDLLLQDDLGDDARRLALDAGRDGSPDGLRKALQRLANCPEFQLA